MPGKAACSKRTRICKAYSRLSSVEKNETIRTVYRRGKRFVNRDLSLYVVKNGLNETRLAVSVSKKNGNSVVRHRIQRLVKEVFRLCKPELAGGYDVVVRFHKDVRIGNASSLTYADMKAYLSKPMRQASLL